MTARRIVPLCVALAITIAPAGANAKHRHRHRAVACANADTSASAASKAAMRAAVLCLVNAQRTSRGLPALHENSHLDSSAQGWTNRMVLSGVFSHGSNFAGRISAAGYDWSYAGENIATGFATPREVVSGWMGSTGHCENILSLDYADVGTGLSVHPLGSFGPATWTQDFGLLMGHSQPSHNGGPANGCPY